MEEAYVFVALSKLQGTKVTGAEFKAQLSDAKAKANKQNFPDLVDALNTTLSEPLHWEKEFLSLNKARNCLEHRGGVIVQDKDTDPNASTLTLSFPRVQIYVEREGQEIEITPPFAVEAGEEISFRAIARERSFAVGERITVNAEEFGEIAFACWIMADELASKLPGPSKPSDSKP